VLLPYPKVLNSYRHDGRKLMEKARKTIKDYFERNEENFLVNMERRGKKAQSIASVSRVSLPAEIPKFGPLKILQFRKNTTGEKREGRGGQNATERSTC